MSCLFMRMATNKAAIISAVELPDPDGEEHGMFPNHKLSRAKQSGLYLICAAGFQLHIWWHGDGAAQWMAGGYHFCA
jgi:hypothetical protein